MGALDSSSTPTLKGNSGPFSSTMRSHSGSSHRDIVSISTEESESDHPVKYRGRLRRWPGMVFLVLLVLISTSLILLAGRRHHSTFLVRLEAYKERAYGKKSIAGGADGSDGIADLDDGEIGNPAKYPPSECAMPDYQSKQGKIYAVAANGTEIPISIKGVNWFGMETGQAIVFGLWDNATAGTTAYHIASYLSDNKFNAVRLPLMVDHLLKNTPPTKGMLNTFSNQAVSAKDYLSMLKSIIQVLQFRRIGVLISMHTLIDGDTGGLWYNDAISEDDFLSAIDILTSNLCSSDYWNVMGIDVKNEPYKAQWGSGPAAKDFRLGAARITERMLEGCPNWMGFVEGLNYRSHNLTIDGDHYEYNDWYGGGLQDVKEHPIEMTTPNKIVWAPHYYTSAVYVQDYFYGGGTVDWETKELDNFVELDDETLKLRVSATMQDMFGYLLDEQPQYALLLGEFGGLYARDEHPKKTIQRTVDDTIAVMVESGYAGGFAWSLNPESKYQYCSADKGGLVATFEEGLLELDWLTTNVEYLSALAALDALPDLRRLPCFALQ